MNVNLDDTLLTATHSDLPQKIISYICFQIYPRIFFSIFVALVYMEL